MTTDEIKVWLDRGRGLAKEIEALKEARQNAEYKATGTKAGVRKMTAVVKKERGDGRLVALADYSKELDRQIAERADVLTEIQTAIGLVDNCMYRILLTSYYVNDKDWFEISEFMDIHKDNARGRIHKKAIEAVRRKMP